MRALSFARAAAAFCVAFVAMPASAQSLSTMPSDGLAPMSLMPEAAPIPKAGTFGLVAPAPISQGDSTGVAPPPLADEPPAIRPRRSAAAEETETTPVLKRVPMPPRRPFNLGTGKKRNVLLAKLPEKEAVIAAAPVPAAASMTRSLVPLESLPGVRDRGNKLIQEASLPKDDGIQSDAPSARDFVGEGQVGGGILKQTPSVQIGCLRPDLLALLRKASKRFGRPIVVTSGFRGGGRRGSYHRKCMAADVVIKGVPKQTLAAYFRSLPEAGGVGTYCHNGVVHIDTAEPRNWTYCGFRRTSFSLRNGGWGEDKHVRAGQVLPEDGGE